MSPRPSTSDTLSTRERLMQAALQVFAERGVKGATTREIAQVAGVNEATLFRTFQSKDFLLKALVESAAQKIRDTLDGPGMSHNDLVQDLTYYANVYHEVLYQNEPMVRMMVGEAHRQPEAAHQIACAAWTPVRQRLVNYLERAKTLGQVRADLDATQLVEMLVSMLMGFMLRRKVVHDNFTPKDYLETALTVFLQGIAPKP